MKKEAVYREYLESAHWQEVRTAILAGAGGKCARCGATVNLDVHHKTYARVGAERPEDLELLCRSCHYGEHESQRHDKALNTYATKKYGDHWDEDERDVGRVEEEFDEWLERKREAAW